MEPMFIWIEAAAKMSVGEKIYVPLGTRTFQAMKKLFEQCRLRFAVVSPVVAEQLSCKKIDADGQSWLVILKSKPAPPVAYKTDSSGKVVPIFPPSPERIRQIKLMLEDGMNLVQIREVIPDIKPEELV